MEIIGFLAIICMVEINPTLIIVRDLGSLNDTFINGEWIGKRKSGMAPDETRKLNRNNLSCIQALRYGWPINAKSASQL